jgi:DNA repair exonuclease SbcCD ATPase subunit
MKFNELKGLVNLNKKLNDQKMNLEKIKLNWKNNELEICKLKEIIFNLEENIENRKELEKKIKEVEKEIILLELKLDENIKKIKEILLLRKELNRYNNISKLFTEERLIERLLTQIIDNTEKIINNVLKDLTNFSLKFELNREGISIYKSYNEELIDAKFLSGYEMFVSNIALRIAFGKLNRYIKTNFMIIDEGFASCSNTNIVKIDNVFDIIRKYYKWCIVVSHLDQIKNNFDNSYSITKVDKTNDSLVIIN